MKLDKIKIGVRVRHIREEVYHETRQLFAERCSLSENHLGKLERGELLPSIDALNKICSNAGVKSDYILYGQNDNHILSIRKSLDEFLDKSSKEELRMYFKCISSMKSYINKI